jgi:hypothetical protein
VNSVSLESGQNFSAELVGGDPFRLIFSHPKLKRLFSLEKSVSVEYNSRVNNIVG